jgi:hypothetical protein
MAKRNRNELMVFPRREAITAALREVDMSWGDLADAIVDEVPRTRLGIMTMSDAARVPLLVIEKAAEFLDVHRDTICHPQSIGPRKMNGKNGTLAEVRAAMKRDASAMHATAQEALEAHRAVKQPAATTQPRTPDPAQAPTPAPKDDAVGGMLDDAAASLADALAAYREQSEKPRVAVLYRELVAVFHDDGGLTHQEAVTKLRKIVSDAKRFQSMQALLR